VPLNTYNTFWVNQLQKNCTSTNHAHHCAPLARCSQPLSTNQTPHPTTKTGRQPPGEPRRVRAPPLSWRRTRTRACCLKAQ